ncbi:MAG: hypothetical protein A3G25_09200 [Betaproteobacteria bacterium RIFCSPLOWO2_12_FULL_63_13]|nr:MAG: hypothetical protein A3G25_09200 [Betaproteobacteria bacterium RIFCSPLOWO2_12_FULL_63_13]
MILHKYLSPDRAALLENRNIRLTQHDAFNDPFESDPCPKNGFAKGNGGYSTRRPTQTVSNPPILLFQFDPAAVREFIFIDLNTACEYGTLSPLDGFCAPIR